MGQRECHCHYDLAVVLSLTLGYRFGQCLQQRSEGTSFLIHKRHLWQGLETVAEGALRVFDGLGCVLDEMYSSAIENQVRNHQVACYLAFSSQKLAYVVVHQIHLY